MKDIARLIQSRQNELAETALETLFTSKVVTNIDLSEEACLEILKGTFSQLQRDLTPANAKAKGYNLAQYYLKTFQKVPKLRQNFHAQLAILGIARVVLNHFLVHSAQAGSENFQVRLEKIQKIFDHSLISLGEWWGQIYNELRQKDRQLIDELNVVKNDLQHQLNVIYQILKESPVGAADCDEKFTVLHWNPMAVRLTGYQPADILKKSILNIFTGKSRNRLLQKLQSDRRKITNLRLHIQPQTGAPFPALVSLSKIRAVHPGNIFYVINFQEINNPADFRVGSHRLNQLTTINRLTSAIMHDVRNPVNSIGLNMELLEDLFQRENVTLSPAIHETINRVHRDIDQLGRNLNQYLTYTTLNELNPEPLNLTLRLKSFIEELRVETLRPGVPIHFRSGSEETWIQGDWLQLQRVFRNMLQNAAEAISGEGEIRIDVRQRNNRITLRIEDNGTGITPQEKEKIFSPFYTSKKSGTGLGLYIAREIVLAHRGRIRCHSMPGKGTTFSLSFPAFKNDGEIGN